MMLARHQYKRSAIGWAIACLSAEAVGAEPPLSGNVTFCIENTFFWIMFVGCLLTVWETNVLRENTGQR